jgi:hypothetical protein
MSQISLAFSHSTPLSSLRMRTTSQARAVTICQEMADCFYTIGNNVLEWAFHKADSDAKPICGCCSVRSVEEIHIQPWLGEGERQRLHSRRAPFEIIGWPPYLSFRNRN